MMCSRGLRTRVTSVARPERLSVGKKARPPGIRTPAIPYLANRLRRASPKTGERRSLRKINAELAAAGYFNERGQPFNPNSIRLMLSS